MNLKHKLVIILFSVVLIYSGVGYWIVNNVIQEQNATLSQSLASKDMDRCHNIKNEYISKLTSIVKDWAKWDDTYYFIQNKNKQAYITANLNYSTFKNLDIDILLFYDARGTLQWGGVLTERNGKESFDNECLALLNNTIKQKYPILLAINKHRSGIIRFGDSLAVVSSSPIKKTISAESDPSIGTIVMGRWLTKKVINELSRNILVDFDIIPLTSTNLKTYADVINSLDSGSMIYFQEKNEEEEFLYAYARDINNKPAFLFQTIYKRDFYKDIQAMLILFLKSILAIGIILILLQIGVFQYIIVNPILGLTNHIIKIKTHKRYSIGIPTKRKDEIGMLTNQFNEMQRILKDYDENLEKLVEARTNEVQQFKKDTIIRLAMAAEKRDTDTGNHIERISKYSRLLAEKIGLNFTDCEIISWASILHDIGKVGIPDVILKKPDKLTDEEYNKMKEHTIIGRNILDGSTSELLITAKDIAFCHHECWNGKGYPSGFSGESIPLAARIVAIADVFDALLSKRIYKEPYTISETIEFFKAKKGEIFDPHLTDIFIRNIQEFLDIRKKS